MGVCPAIAGRYADKGSAFSKEGKPLGQVSLTGLLHGHDRSSSSWLTNANVVVVMGPTNRLLGFQSWSDDQLLGKGVWQELRPFRWGGELGDRYYGYRGFVWLRLEWTGSVSVVGFGGGQSNESLWLRQAVDGSLVAFHKKEAIAYFLLVPVCKSQAQWCQFPPVAESSIGATKASVTTNPP